MNEHDASVDRLELIGYEKLTDHGFALPVFGRFEGANVYYTARSSAPGEAGGRITGFDGYEPESLVQLPFEQVRETGVGEPWLDIFLWDGVPYVGTALDIWNEIADLRETISEHAPLSLLALAEEVNRGPDIQLVHKTFSWLTTRYGRRKALEWRNDTYLRGILVRGLRREFPTHEPQVAVHQEVSTISAYTNFGAFFESETAWRNNIAAMHETFDFFTRVAKSFGLHGNIGNLETGPTRTSEDVMRIAALQVAAGKPHGKATTTELKNEVNQYLDLTSEDLLPSKTRPNEAMYQQIVGNIVSHRQSKANIFAQGWAIYTGDGIQITDEGRQYLKNLGYEG